MVVEPRRERDNGRSAGVSDTCRTCHRAIIWAKTPNGKAMPLDEREVLVAEIVQDGAENQITRMVRGYPSHFSTCAQAAQHRRPPDGDARSGHAMPRPQEFRQPHLFHEPTMGEPE